MVAMSYFCRQNVSQISLEIVANRSHPSEILALGILKYSFFTNSSCQVFLLSERIVSYKYGVLIRLTYMYTVWSNFSYKKCFCILRG